MPASPGLLYISGNNASYSIAGTSGTVSGTFYIPGDTVVVFATLLATSTGVSCADSNLNPLTAGPSVTYGSDTVYSFYYTVPSTTPANFKVSWVGNSKAVIQYAEYYGVLSVNASLSPNTATGVTGNPTITTTTTGPNSYVVCGMAGGNAPAITGTLRELGGVSLPSMSLITIDNTAVSAGSVTVTTTDLYATWGVVALELLYAPAPAIVYVGGAKNDTTSANTTLTATYTAEVVGDEIVVFVETEVPAGPITVKGNTTSTALTAGPVESTATASIYSFYGPAQATDTGYVANWTNSSAASSITLGEYIGVQSVLNSYTNTATSTTAQIATTPVITYANDWLVAALGNVSGAAFTLTNGTTRQSVTASATRQMMIDNTGVTAGATVPISATLANHIWVATTLELVAYQAATSKNTNQLMMMGVGT